jgi:hypothetical protein
VPSPNFFLVGATKSGTTSMFRSLAAHPEICMARDKEPHFFGADLGMTKGPISESLSVYLGLFDHADGEPVVGEASTSYLLSATAAGEIAAFCPQARILVMLRNPVEVLYALYSEVRAAGVEPIADFPTALDAADRGRDVSWVPGGFGPWLRYYEVVAFSTQLERYLDWFGPERVKVVVYDDLVAESGQVYAEVLRFLGLDPSVMPAFELANPNAAARSFRLQRALTMPSARAKRAVRRALPAGTRQALRRRLTLVNQRSTTRPPMDPLLRRRLQQRLADEVGRLGELVDRDLSHWLDPATA